MKEQDKDKPHIVVTDCDYMGFPQYVHRQWGESNSMTIEDYPMVFRNRSVASKVRRKANRESCNGLAMEKLFEPSELEDWCWDAEGGE